MHAAFAALIRVLDDHRSRRSLAPLVAGVTLGGGHTAAPRLRTQVEAANRGTGCPPCQTRRKEKGKPKKKHHPGKKKKLKCFALKHLNGDTCLGDRWAGLGARRLRSRPIWSRAKGSLNERFPLRNPGPMADRDAHPA